MFPGSILRTGFGKSMPRKKLEAPQEPIQFPRVFRVVGGDISLKRPGFAVLTVEKQEDGSLAFRGRNDRMVKVRGYRIELGEIDQVIRKKEGMDEVANVNVTVHGGDLICCYYTGTETSPAELKKFAAKWLPE